MRQREREGGIKRTNQNNMNTSDEPCEKQGTQVFFVVFLQIICSVFATFVQIHKAWSAILLIIYLQSNFKSLVLLSCLIKTYQNAFVFFFFGSTSTFIIQHC